MAKRLAQLQKIPISEHHRSTNLGTSMSSLQKPVNLNIKSHVIANCMEKFQVLLDLDDISFDEIK